MEQLDQKISFSTIASTWKEYLGVTNNQKRSVPGHGYFSKLEQFESLHCEKGELYMARRLSCQEQNDQQCKR